MPNKEVEKAEREFYKKAHEMREAYRSSAEVLREAAESFLKEMILAHNHTADSVVTITKTRNEKGEIHTSVIPGVGSVGPPGDRLVTTNLKSRKERMNRIRQIIKEVEGIIETLKRGGPAPDNLMEHMAELKSSIPDRNEYELVGKPK